MNTNFSGLLKFNIVAIVFVLFAVRSYGAVNPPQLRCASVDVNGNTTINWIPPVDPLNEFVRYDVFVSNNKNGPYTSTIVNGIGTISDTDLLNDASVSSFFYFVQTVYDEGMGNISSNSSDTIQSILPAIGLKTDSTAQIEWEPLFDPNIASNFGVYRVFRKIGGSGTYVQIGTTNYGNEIYNDEFKVCSEEIFYKIEIDDASGCTSYSAEISELFEDRTPPATPQLDSVTVVNNNGVEQVQLGWQPSTSPDATGYLVFVERKVPPGFISRDTVYGFSYTETLPILDPSLDWQEYTVSAFDSCHHPAANTSPGADPQRTMFLSNVPNTCEKTVSLTWTSYINWDDLEAYEIWVSVNGQPYVLEQSIPNTDTTYTFQKPDDLALYCFKIKAVNTGKVKSSTSNRNCVHANSGVVPAQQYFKEISVINNQDIYIETLTDSTLPVSNYVLFRSIEPVTNFFEVAKTPFANSSIVQIDDTDASVTETSYYYRIGVEDTCGSIMFISKSASSIYLRGILDEDSTNVNLEWNKYFAWDSVGSGVKEYAIHMIVDGVKSEIGTVADSTTNFVYPFIENIGLGANICFEIEAREDTGNIFNQRDTVYSNQVCFTDNLKVFVPNAFRPGGENPIFYPVFSFGDIGSYRMLIYNRWGGLVYETTDINQGWDGTKDGENAQFGAYVYHIEVANFTGASLHKKGTFLLLR